jgi:WD40 repeat protein
VETTLEGHSGSVNSVFFSPDGQKLASGSNDNTIKIWDLGKISLRSFYYLDYITE